MKTIYLKVYPKQGPGPGFVAVGASAGTVDPKTHQKWVWEFIETASELVHVVVSLFYIFTYICIITSNQLSPPLLPKVVVLPCRCRHFTFVSCNSHTHTHTLPPVPLPPPLASPPQIIFDSHLNNNIDNDCLMSVDGTDFPKLLPKRRSEEGECLRIPQVRGEVRPKVRARG